MLPTKKSSPASLISTSNVILLSAIPSEWVEQLLCKVPKDQMSLPAKRFVAQLLATSGLLKKTLTIAKSHLKIQMFYIGFDQEVDLAQFPYDEFSKNLLEMALGSIGHVEAAKTVASEIREIDLYFVPHNPSPATPALGLLERLAFTATSFEPFRNPVAPEHVKSCLAKLLDLHGELTRTAKREKRPSIPELLKKLQRCRWVVPTEEKHCSYWLT
jgi:hypothetical protein